MHNVCVEMMQTYEKMDFTWLLLPNYGPKKLWCEYTMDIAMNLNVSQSQGVTRALVVN